ncbi:murein hydrolase activator EnvC family protein [Marinicella sp. W31]|uniref:murein hydrolase activator EnvC family protein n=1 Tax=Marinicella sp. W31 TaxID=3023713 RepID=UPI003757E575
MKHVLMLCGWLLINLFLCDQSLAQNNSNEAEIKQQLDGIRQRLTELKTSLNQATGEEAKLINELEKQDQRINQQGRLIIEIENKIDTFETQIDTLNADIQTKNNSIQSQKSQIISLLKLSLYISHDRVLKSLLLNPETDSAELTRHQIRFLQQRLYALIREIAEQILALQEDRTTLDEQKNLLENEKQELVTAQEQLLTQKQQRSLVLQSLQKTIAEYRSESENLAQDRNRLNNLLSEIQTLLDDLPDDLGENISFTRLKGQLIRPLLGAIIRSYRSLRSGQARWDGIVIGNEAGLPIKSVAYGRVAFADWLRGYGLLIVIDHGNDYMTLYGHNQSILVEVGDWVQPQEHIATAGNSGNIQSSGLYFEIRKAAEPTNPVSWFQK